MSTTTNPSLSSFSTTTTKPRPQTNPPTLRPGTRVDLPALAATIAAGFLDFELYDHFLPGRRAQYQQFYRFLLLRLKGLYADPTTRFFVAESDDVTLSASTDAGSTTDEMAPPATSPTGKTVLGFSVWMAEGDGNPLTEEWTRQGYDAGGTGRNSWSHALSAAAEPQLLYFESMWMRIFLNRICDHRVLAHLRAILHHNFDSSMKRLHLQFLITHPRFHGTGVGHRLLQWGLELARERGLPVVLESSLMGRPFYERRGFKVVKLVRIGEEGDGKAYDLPIMVWEPKGMEGRWIEEDEKTGWRLRAGLGSVEAAEGQEVIEESNA